MKAIDELQNQNYDLGLSRIRSAIKQTLTQAGARMEAGCVSRPGWRKLKRATAEIIAVPWNGPKITVKFTTDEIAASWGEFHPDVQGKIELYAAAFLRYHLRSDRSGLLFQADSLALSTKSK